MKIVVDSNIVFSALLKTETTFGQIIFNSDGIFDFYSANYMRSEILRHWDRLRQISLLSDRQLEESYYTLLTKISFINEEVISKEIWEESESIVATIDIDDIDFVALAMHMGGKLWTGDKVLRDGLRKHNFDGVLSTPEILELWTIEIGRRK